MRRVTCCQCECCDYMVNMVLFWVLFVNLALKEVVLHHPRNSPHKKGKEKGVFIGREREKNLDLTVETLNVGTVPFSFPRGRFPDPGLNLTYLDVPSGCHGNLSFQLSPEFHCVPPGIDVGANACCHVRHLSVANNLLVWFFIPVLCRWHPAVLVFSPNDPLVLDKFVSHPYSHGWRNPTTSNSALLKLLPANQLTQYNRHQNWHHFPWSY